MAHGGEVGTEDAAAQIVQGGASRFFGGVEDGGFEGGEDPQAGGLAERDEADGGGDQVGGESLQVGCRGGVLRDLVRAGYRADGDRVRDAFGRLSGCPMGWRLA